MVECNSYPIVLSSFATILASCLDDDELELVAASFTQIGDTLTLIAVQRSIFSEKTNSSVTTPYNLQNQINNDD